MRVSCAFINIYQKKNIKYFSWIKMPSGFNPLLISNETGYHKRNLQVLFVANGLPSCMRSNVIVSFPNPSTPVVSLSLSCEGRFTSDRPFKLCLDILALWIRVDKQQLLQRFLTIYVFLPWQVFPFPWKPSGQVQINQPSLFVQVASAAQSCVLAAHSSISKQGDKLCQLDIEIPMVFSL